MVDLTNCDREPIHIPGTIQAFGVLLVLAEPALTITQVSDNVGEHLPLGVMGILGKPLSAAIDPDSVDRVREALREERWYETNPVPIVAHGRQFDGIVHRHAGAAILELEPNPGPPIATRHPFRGALMRIQRVSTLAELATVVVQQLRQVTGFERVLFYRFHEDGHGSVDAEAREPALEPYLGLHYPASDIPAQARKLYCKNGLRLIVDARATQACVVPPLRADTGEALDLTFAVLRGISPVHLEYMTNMGVRSSMSISLIVGDRLWGLISCLNHTGPRRASQEMRTACEFMGRLTSQQIAALADRELLTRRVARRATTDALADAMREAAATDQVLGGLLAHPEELMGLVGATGAAVVSAGKTVTCGRTPSPALIRDIAEWVDEKKDSRPFATSSLGTAFPRAREASEVCSGLLTFALPGAPERRLLWFRPEIIQIVSWGGDPSKPATADSSGRLHPRNSFALWREEVRLRSQRWTASDLEAADEFRRRAIEVDLERQLASVQRAVQEREELMALVSHDLRTPLSTILMRTKSMLNQTPAGDDERVRVLLAGVERIHRSASHMRVLIDDLVDMASIHAEHFTLHLRPVKTRDLIDDAMQAASPLAEAKRITLAMDLIDSPRVEADAERVFRVLSNLLGNAIKFTPKGGAVTVCTERRGGELVISVIDNGPGITADELSLVFERYWKARPASQVGTGLGLYIARQIVEAHGGRIWAESSGDGARLCFTLPLTSYSSHAEQRAVH